MSQNRFRSIAFRAIAGISLVLVLSGLLFAIEQRRTREETGAVLSAFFSQAVVDGTDQSGAGSAIEVFLQRNPDCRMCSWFGSEFANVSWFGQSLKSRESSLSGDWFAQSSRITRASFFLNSVFSTDISTNLRLPHGARAVFLDPADLTHKWSASGVFVVSHVGLNLNKNEALFYIDHFCPGLCGGGGYVLMRKVDGVWHIADRRVTWVS